MRKTELEKNLMKCKANELTGYKLYIDERDKNMDLNLKYLDLLTKYNKLLNEVTKKDTEFIIYDGELYGITTIDFHKTYDEIDSIELKATHRPREKGLIDNLSDTFKNIAKEFNKTLFGDK